jgi:hypothetical protein
VLALKDCAPAAPQDPGISKANDILKWAPKTKLEKVSARPSRIFKNLLSDNAAHASIVHDYSAKA